MNFMKSLPGFPWDSDSGQNSRDLLGEDLVTAHSARVDRETGLDSPDPHPGNEQRYLMV